jgi:mannose-6-phosphate isomerase-like protein (cupin superfamily)
LAAVVPMALSKDNLKATVEEIIARHDDGKWSERVVSNEHFSMTVIHQPPGTPNDHHYHLTDEVWFIYKGELTWQYEHHPEPVHVKTGDIIFAPRGLWHHIEPIGTENTVRIACTPAGEFHRYDRPGCKELPKS